VDLAIDAAGVLALGAAMLFPASLISKKDIVVSSWQSMPTPFWPDLEGDAMIFENLPGCIGCAMGPPLISRSRVSEASAILPSANPGNRFLAMTIESNESRLDAINNCVSMRCAQFFERNAPGTPLIKLSLSAYAQLIKFREVDVMQTKSARQFPNAFDGLSSGYNRIE
jgi:hypothetical protein